MRAQRSHHRDTRDSYLFALALLVACGSRPPPLAPPPDEPYERHLGQSTASPGSDPSRLAPLTADDPTAINVSRPVRRLPGSTPVVLEPDPDAPSRRDQATSSTEVTLPPDIAPVSTTEIPDQPGVFSPPPPPPGRR